MPPSKVVPFLPAALERETRSILDHAEVFDIASYGWLNESDPDPKFIGHAMWQVDQPSIDHEALFGERPVRRRPRELEGAILGVGEELETRGVQDARLIEPTSSLRLFGAQIFSDIDRRNGIVHDVATRMAKMKRESVSELQERFDREQLHGFTPSPMPEDEPSWIAAHETRTNQLRSDLDGSVQEIIDWYRLLINASNAVFQVEYWSRALAQ